MELNINAFNIIIISGVVYGVIFGLIVLSQKKYRVNHVKYLSLVVLFLSLSNFQYWLIDTELIAIYPVIRYIYFPWQWLILPMFYFYVQKFIGKKPISTTLNILLIGPFIFIQIIHLLQVAYQILIDNDYVIPSHFSRGIFVYIEFFSIIFNLLLMISCFRMISNHENDTFFDLKTIKSKTRWLKKLIYLGMLVCLFWLIGVVIVVVWNLDKSYVFYSLWIGVSILIYWIGHLGLQKSKELEEQINLRKKRTDLLTDNGSKNEIKDSADSRGQLIIQEIDQLFDQDKLYLDPNLSLELLSQRLNYSTSYLSKIINTHKNISFKDYVNDYRLNEASKLLKDESFIDYTIVSIGLECGFNSKSAFYSAFKKSFNMTPSAYRGQ